MAMEVEILNVTGATKDAVLSVRAGGKRRQVLANSITQGTPLRFPTGLSGVNPFKIDLLQSVKSARFALRPGEGVYTTSLKGPNGDNVRVDFAVCEIGQRPSMWVLPAELDASVASQPIKDDDMKWEPPLLAAQNYLEQHKLMPFIRALLQTVVRTRPQDPFGFIEEQFRNASMAVNKGDNGKIEPHDPQTNLPGGQEMQDLEACRRILDNDVHTINKMLTVEELKQMQAKIDDAINARRKEELIEDDSPRLLKACLPNSGEDSPNLKASQPNASEDSSASKACPPTAEENSPVLKARRPDSATVSEVMDGEAKRTQDDEFTRALNAHRLQFGQNLQDYQNSILGWLKPNDALTSHSNGDAAQVQNSTLGVELKSSREQQEAAKIPGDMSSPEARSEELEDILQLKAKLLEQRDELAAMNASLKKEVKQLNESLESLVQERDTLRDRKTY